METRLQPTALRCQNVAFISILLTNIWCAHLGTDPGCKSIFMRAQMLSEASLGLKKKKKKNNIHKLIVADLS